MFMGIDLGTSGVKVCLVGEDLMPVVSATVALKISHPRSGYSEQNPQDWWLAVQEAVAKVLDLEPRGTSSLRGIGLSGQMHGAVLLDRQKQVIRPAILWNDGRSDAECAALVADRPELSALAGVTLMAGFTAPKILWLKAHEPESYARIRHVLLPKDYLGLQMHGQMMTDPCDAAGTWWFDEAARRWSPELCAATATNPDWLPQVRDGPEIAGYLRSDVAALLGLPAGIPIATGGGDAAAGAIAVGAVKDGAGFISLGTSGQLFVTTDTFRAAPDEGIHSYAHCVPKLWFQMAAMLNGARPMSWFSEMTDMPVGDLLTEAEGARLDRVPLFLPYLTGERTPHGDARIRGAFYGLDNDTGRPEMMRAIVDAIAYSFADARDAIASVTPVPRPLLAIGGGSKSNLLLQTIADVMGSTLHQGEDSDVGPALGAARLGAVAAGVVTVGDLGWTPQINAVFEPLPTGRHEGRLTTYHALYAALKGVRDLPR
ncbi:xylulokinase [Pseudooceanicola sediminis]|uniref:Xylulose kinase n=1 Tax=Pseudooceanicola sediminis TaxID=2211117 RepID=A0A399J5U8_9RHOB|nr:xylulokinase [Pseudooceanicola sediminis]KAA2316757.1 xylulokinase [Puniceibacterium sp. HSS470]RII40785.1 xylulokinase [Pseudooceanicola sediminis]|tara:strand:- start:276053 stop:277510 length:1458 start_codon:yes stop_codon:yes gene_type:complete